MWPNGGNGTVECSSCLRWLTDSIVSHSGWSSEATNTFQSQKLTSHTCQMYPVKSNQSYARGRLTKSNYWRGGASFYFSYIFHKFTPIKSFLYISPTHITQESDRKYFSSFSQFLQNILATEAAQVTDADTRKLIITYFTFNNFNPSFLKP